MPRKPASVEGSILRLDFNLLPEDLHPHPSQVRQWGMPTQLSYNLALMMGKTARGVKVLEVAESGILKVAPVGSGYEHNDSKKGVSAAAYGAAIPFDDVCSEVEVWLPDEGIVIQRSLDGVNWDDEIELEGGMMYPMQAATAAVRLKSLDPLKPANYRLVGWY